MAVSRNTENPLIHLLADIPPRSLEATRKLASIGLALLAVKISRLSAAVGLRLEDVPLPMGTLVLAVGRGGTRFFPHEAGYYEVDDLVFLLHDQRHEPALREIFTSPAPLCVVDFRPREA